MTQTNELLILLFPNAIVKNCSVERYNPETNTWTRIADMANRRSGAGVGVVDEKLYAIGMYMRIYDRKKFAM